MMKKATKPNTSTAQLHRAISHHQAGRLKQAEQAYRTLLQAQPNHPDACHYLGILHLRQGHWGQAGGLLKRALEANPAAGQYWLSFLDYLLQAGLLEQMEAMLADGQQRGLRGPAVEGLGARLADAKARVNQHQQWERAGNYARMEQAARQDIERLGANPARAHALGKALLLQGRDQEALPHLQHACEGAPMNINAWNQQALALNHLGQFAQAEACYCHVLELLPDAADVLGNLAANCSDAGHYDRAIEYAKRALQRQPRHVAARVNMANALHETQRLAEAQEVFNAIYREGVRHPLAMTTQVLNLRALGRLDEAVRLVEELITLAPRLPEARIAAAEIALDLGDFERARQALELVLQANPVNVMALAGWVRTRKMTPADQDWLARAKHCLNFHQTQRRVGTASNWQVRQPIYTSSRERWRHYAQYLGPLLPLRQLDARYQA
jgi:tetratricopeptide (TPR) repeat protein